MSNPISTQFDVFLSYNRKEETDVERIFKKLRRAGINPWFDKCHLTFGGDWMTGLADGLRASAACAVFIGPHDVGDWQRLEQQFATDRMAKDRAFRVFLVLLPGLPEPFDAGTLPPFLALRNWVDLRKGIENTRAFQRLINAVKGVPPDSERSPEQRNDVCPYRGLQTFDEAHAEFFFGRDGDIQRLVEKLKGTRFLAVIGPSGSGKSSLVRAGLIPKLREGHLPGSETWPIQLFTPTAHPLKQLAANLLRLYPQNSMKKTLDEMANDERALDQAVALAMADRKSDERAVLVVDQFEEFFTLCTDEHERAKFLANLRQGVVSKPEQQEYKSEHVQFLANLLYAAFVPGGRTVVVLTMRADFYPKCAAYPELSARLAEHQFLVSPMGSDGLRQAIEEPAWHVGLEFEAGLAATILDDVNERPGALPLLEHALLELWNLRRGGMLTLEAYRESGAVEGAIAKRADAIFNAFNPEQQAIVRRVMIRLTQLGEGTEDTRRRATMSELITRPEESDAVERVVKEMADASLLTTSANEETGERVVEVSHEALIQGWPKLRDWLNKDRAGLLIHRRLTDAVEEWRRAGRDQNWLYRGVRLAQTMEWRKGNETSLNDLEREFLDDSVRLQTTEQRRQYLLKIGIPILLLAMVVAAYFGYRQWTHSRSRELTLRAESFLSSNPKLSVILAEKAIRQTPTAEAGEILRRSIVESHFSITLNEHTQTVNQARFSNDGKLIATAGDDSLIVWEATSGRKLAKATGGVKSVAFCRRDNRTIVTAGNDDVVRLWLLDTGKGQLKTKFSRRVEGLVAATFDQACSRIVAGSTESIAWVWAIDGNRAVPLHASSEASATVSLRTPSFSPEGNMILTAGSDGIARIWDAVSGQLLKGLPHNGNVFSTSFNYQGTRVVTSCEDGAARIWGLDGRRPIELLGHQGPVFRTAFSNDGRRVATASADKTARIWDTETGRVIAILQGHTGGISKVLFSPNGQLVATASDDGTARIWNVDLGQPLAVLRGHSGRIRDIDFSPDGNSVVTSSEDQTARIWQIASWQLLAQKEYPGDLLAISPDGRQVLINNPNHSAQVYDTGNGQILCTLQETGGGIKSASFDVAGKKIATTSEDGSLTLWRTGQKKLVLGTHNGKLPQRAFSPDGRKVITVDTNNAQVWDVNKPEQRFNLPGHRGEIYDAAFSIDGKQIVTASQDNTARLWDATKGSLLFELRGHSSPVHKAAFSPNGQWVVTASKDNTARIWEAATGRMLTVLSGHFAPITNVTFGGDGSWVLTASQDKTVRLWRFDGTSGGDGFVGLLEYDTPINQAEFIFGGKSFTMVNLGQRAVRTFDCLICGSVEDLLKLIDEHKHKFEQLTPEEKKSLLP